MAVQALDVSPGKPYHHSFIYDLESFFWIIYWSAAAHLDAKNSCPTSDAQDVLNSMNKHNLKSIWGWKHGQLSLCADNPDKMKQNLAEFNNEWGLSPLFQDVIIQLGTFFCAAINQKTRTKLESSPGSTMLEVVNIIQIALATNTSH
jgi:hypothetical protein